MTNTNADISHATSHTMGATFNSRIHSGKKDLISEQSGIALG